LFVPNLELPRDFLLKDDILFKQHDETIAFVLLSEDENKAHPIIVYQKILPYLKIASLFSVVSPTISGTSGHGIKSKVDFGKEIKKRPPPKIDISYEDKKELLVNFEMFLNETKSIYEKYYSIIEEFPFIKRALNYYYDSKIDTVYDDDGFVKGMMSMEALFNESAQDIAYKLRVRISLLIGLTKFSSTEVFEIMPKLYDLRNKIVHGLEIPQDTIEIRSKISKYSGEAIKIMLILCENRLQSFKEKGYNSDTKKKRILNEIDESLINQEKYLALKEEISSKINSLRLSFEEKYEDRRWVVFRDKNAIT
jgi:hypothetical protein